MRGIGLITTYMLCVWERSLVGRDRSRHVEYESQALYSIVLVPCMSGALVFVFQNLVPGVCAEALVHST